MGDNFGLESNGNLTFIEFDDQQIASIGAALQAVADQIECPKVDQQPLSNYQVTVVTSASYVSSKRNNDKAVVNAEISNQLLLESSNELSSYLNKKEPILQEFAIDFPAPDDETAWSEDMHCSKEIESMYMQCISDEGSGLSTDCGNETLVGGESIDFIEPDSQQKDDNQNVEKETISIDFNKFICHICPECGVDCGSYSKWKLHTETEHKIPWLKYISKAIVDGESCYRCLQCKKDLLKRTSWRLLQEHQIRHMPHSYYLKCNICDKRFQTLNNVYQHIKQAHTNPTFDFNNFIRHICPECGVDCGPYSKWKLHTETKHKISWHNVISKTNLDGESCYQCLRCKKKLNKKSSFRSLQEHYIKHLPHTSYLICNFCDKRFQLLIGARSHIKQKHSNLISPFLKNKHSNLNIKYIKIFCPICQESLLNVRLWKQHLIEKHDYENKIKSEVIQIDENMYSCKLCQRKICHDYINEHMLMHEQNKSFQCSLCKKYDTHLKAAAWHISRTHFCNNRNKLFECSFCKATFVKKSLLENHYESFIEKKLSTCAFIENSPPRNLTETDT